MPPPVAFAFNLPFEEQIAFFRQKTNLPSEAWDSIWKDAHDRAFIVAGATKAELVNDFRLAIDEAHAQGKSIGWFRKEFDAIVAKHGWTGWAGEGSKAGRDWRTRVIYRTNLASSHAAGRWAQLNDPDLLSVRPCWKYIHSDTVTHPRPIHKSWNGIVLRYDDPWWKTHFCPNGWGCCCRIKAVRPSEYNGNPAPDDGFETKVVNGKSYTVPKGIDVGWDYAPGANIKKTLTQLVEEKAISYPPALKQALHADLRAETAPSAISSFISAAKTDPVNASINTVLQQINTVHKVALLPNVTVKSAFSSRFDGKFDPELSAITLATEAPQPELTLLHEFGHLLDSEAIGELGASTVATHPLFKDWRDAVAGSSATESLQQLRGKIDDRRLDYYLKPSEQWARSYAQYIAIKSKNNLLLSQVGDRLRSNDIAERYSQWQQDEFLPILQSIDDLFVLLGWSGKNVK